MRSGAGDKKKPGLLRQVGGYSLSTQTAQLVTLAAAILSRRFLGPTQTGIWAALQIIVDYSKYATAGFLSATALEIPYQVGKGNLDQAEKIKNLAFTFVTATSSILAFGILVFAYFTRAVFRPEMTYGLYCVSLVIFLQRFNNLLIGILRAFKQFHVESHMMIVSALVNAVLVGVLSYYFNIYGFIVAMIFSLAFNIGYLFITARFRFRWYFDYSLLMPLLKYGVPLLMLGILSTVLKSIDKIMVVRLLGFEQLGIYSIALMACSYMSNFSIAFAIVLVPHFQEKFGARNNPDDLKEILIKSARAFALGMPMMIYAAWLFAPIVIELALPKFLSGVPAMRLLVLNMFFVALAQPFQDALVAIKKFGVIFPLLIGTVVLSFGLNFGAIRLGYGLNGVAMATTLTFFVYFSMVFFFSAAHFLKSGEALLRYAEMVSFFIYLVGGILISAKLLSLQRANTQGVMIAGLCFFAFQIPLVLCVNYHFSLFKKLRVKLPLSF